MPRPPALFKPKKKWRLASHVDPLDYLEHAPDKEGVWRRNYSTLQAFEELVLEVMYDQASRRQILVLSENNAKDRYPDLVIASLGAQRKEKPDGKVSARVLFDGNTRTVCQHQNKTQGPRKGADCRRHQTLDEGKGENRRAHVCTVSRRKRGTPPGTYSPRRLALPWMPSYTWW